MNCAREQGAGNRFVPEPARFITKSGRRAVDDPRPNAQIGFMALSGFPHHLAAGLKSAPRWVGEAALGFVYWLVFLLLLEPGNVLNAIQGHYALAWDQETIRIVGASALGASVTPMLLALVRRFPIEGRSRWRHAAMLAVVTVGLAAALIAVSCILAPVILATETRPFWRALPDEMTGNGPLLVFCIAAFIGLAHAMRFYGPRRR